MVVELVELRGKYRIVVGHQELLGVEVGAKVGVLDGDCGHCALRR